MDRSLELLISIDGLIGNIDENLAKIGDLSKVTSVSVEQIAKQAGASAKKTEGKGGLFGGELGDLSSLKAVGDSVKSFADTIKASIKPLNTLEKVSPKIVATIGGFIQSMNNELSDEKIKSMKNATDFMVAMSNSIYTFSKNLAKSIPFLAIAKPFMGMLTSTLSTFIVGITEQVDRKGLDTKKAKDIAEILSIIGGSIFKFVASLALSTPLLLVAIPGFIALRLMIGGIGFIVEYLSIRRRRILLATTALNRIAVSLSLFTLSLYASMMLMKRVNAVDVLKTLLVIGSFGVVFTALGIASRIIARGALALGVVGLSLLVLAIPLTAISKALEGNVNTLWQLPLLIAGIGGVFALAGAGPVPVAIALGALAMATAGGALMVIGKALTTFASLPKLTKESAEGIRMGISAVIKGFADGAKELRIWKIPKLMATIGVVTTMGASLLSLSLGIRAWLRHADGWTAYDSEVLSTTLISLSNAYADVGRENKGVTKGIARTLLMGKNLQMLSKGILAWANIDQAQTRLARQNIQSILNTIPELFAEMGDEKTGVRKGIARTMRLGKNMKLLAKGILEWKDIDRDQAESARRNIKSILTTIPDIFAEVAGKERAGVKKGIARTMNLGRNMKMLADGVLKWKDITEEEVAKARAGVERILNTLPRAFATLQNRYGKDAKIGINRAKSMIPVISSLGRMVQSFSAQDGVYENLGKGVKSVFGSIYEGITSITDDDVAKLNRLLKPLDKLAKNLKKVSNEIKDHYRFVGKLSEKQTKNFEIWANSLEKISKTDTAKLQIINESIGKTVSPERTGATGGILSGITSRLFRSNQGGGDIEDAVVVSETPATPLAPTTNPDGTPTTTTNQLNQKLDMYMEKLDQVLMAIAENQVGIVNGLTNIETQLQGVIKTREVPNGSF